MRRKTTEEFKKEVYERVGVEYIVLGKYVKAKKHIKMKHEKCGYEYEVTPDSFLQGTRCPNCYGNPLKTTEEFIDEVKKIEKDNYTVLGKYTGAHKKIKMRHEKCGHIYSVTPDLFLSSETRCPLSPIDKKCHYLLYISVSGTFNNFFWFLMQHIILDLNI